MRTIITYITDDGQEFNDQFSAKRHECELTKHNWEFYNEKMGLQKEQNELTHMRFCRHCTKQELIKKIIV